MGLMQKACETYDFHSNLIGKYLEGKEPLAPIAHAVKGADIEITIDQDGRFYNACKADKKKGKKKDNNVSKRLIPVTEKSLGRTSTAVEPHPLCDQLKYVAFFEDSKKFYEEYVKRLKEWAASEFTHPKLKPILRYVENKTIISDLQKEGILKQALLDEKEKKLMICWNVIGLGEEQSGPCWADKSLFYAYSKFYSAQKNKENVFCMVNGKLDKPAVMHAKGIVSMHGNAKLISSNDKENFTYLGRFINSEEALTIGFEASQKAHNALQWLISNQGKYFGKRAFVCWEPQGTKLPSPFDPFLSEDEQEEQTVLPSDYKQRLINTLNGLKTSLPKSTQAVIVAFDAATKGCLAVTYYNELMASDFLDRLYNWDLHCCWPNRYCKYQIQSPSLYNIIACAYGNRQKEQLVVDDKFLCQQMQRLVVCRVDMGRIPIDIVKRLANRASSPCSYENKTYEKLLFISCAVTKKFRYDTKKEEWAMELEPQKQDRSYQFGRLLAIFEKAERDTYKRSGETREPNAVRMQTVFSKRPLYASRKILEQLKKAYYPRLEVGSRVFYDNLIQAIFAALPKDLDLKDLNKPLEETYLMGYYLQRKALYSKNTNKTEENSNDSFEE